MANRNMKNCSSLLIIWATQIKMAMRYHPMPERIENIMYKTVKERCVKMLVSSTCDAIFIHIKYNLKT